jgi:hypothetical protein
MIPQFKQKPLNATAREQAAVPKAAKPFSLDPRTIEQVKRLLASGKTYVEIAEITRVSKSRIGIIAQQVAGLKPERQRSTGISPHPSPRANPTKCSGYAGCECVRCGAEKLRTPDFLRALHAADEAARITPQPSYGAIGQPETNQEPQNDPSSSTAQPGALYAMPAPSRQSP